MLSDPVTTRHMHFATWTEDRRRRWFDWCVTNARQPGADATNWAITRKDSGEVIGWFGIGTSHDASVAGEREFGYLLDRASWNHGYMTEALRAVFAHELGGRGASRLRATSHVANPASARVLEKAGIVREKTVYDADAEGNWARRHHYAVANTDYDARR
jgi:RimJ/RimL family protein N-acetyltransferase